MHLVFVVHTGPIATGMWVSHQAAMVSIHKSQFTPQSSAYGHAHSVFLQNLAVDVAPLARPMKYDESLFYSYL